MSKTIYRFDSNGYLNSTNVVADDYQLKDNETFVVPEKVEKSTVKWNGTGWSQLTDEEDAEYVKAHSIPMPSMPSNNNNATAQKMIDTLGQQVAQGNQTITQLKGMVNMLGQQVAQLSQGKAGN